MSMKSLDAKYKELIKRNKRFCKWENVLEKTLTNAQLTTLFATVTKSPIDWSNMWLIHLISTSTYGFTSVEQTKTLFKQAIENKIIKDFKINGRMYIITLNNGEKIEYVKMTDLFHGIENEVPELLTEARHGKCHGNSYSFAIALDYPCRLCSALCTAQSRKQEFTHSWVELDDENRKLAIDCNYNLVMDKIGYYQIFKPKDVVRIDNEQIKADEELISQTSLFHKDLRMYCFFPDDVRAAAQKELENKNSKQA